MRPDWANEELAEPPKLDSKQLDRLLKMTEVLRAPEYLEQVALMKKAFRKKDAWEVSALWSEFTEDEQMALYIAPGKGGIFTTAERKAIKTGVIE